MKKMIWTMMLLVGAIGLHAQEGVSNIGLTLGFNQPTDRYRTNPLKDTLNQTDIYNGLSVGLAYETTFVKGFGLYMGLNYAFSTVQGKWTQPLPQFAQYERNCYYLHTLNVPVQWQYKFEIAKETYLLLYTGPTMQLGLGWKQRHDIKRGQVTTENIDIYAIDNDNDGVHDYRRFQLQWGLGGGIQYQQYFIRGGYDFGILNSFRDPWYFDQYRFRGRMDGWHITLGMYLWQISDKGCRFTFK